MDMAGLDPADGGGAMPLPAGEAALQAPTAEPARPRAQSAVVSGWMYKQGGLIQTWKKRWFMLERGSGSLWYYKTPQDAQPVPTPIHLYRASMFPDPGGRGGAPPGSKYFTLATPSAQNKRTEYKLAVETQEDYDMWQTAVSTAGSLLERDVIEKPSQAIIGQARTRALSVLKAAGGSLLNKRIRDKQAAEVGVAFSPVERYSVSRNPKRIVESGFDLDFSYITPNIIAMGRPQKEPDAAEDNSFVETLRYFQHKHGGHYKVYNLCSEHGYPCKVFEKNVSIYPVQLARVPFLSDVVALCENAAEFLRRDKRNVVAFHSLGSGDVKEGPSAMMVACLMLRSKLIDPNQVDGPSLAGAALDYYAAIRGTERRRLEMPSQARYARYYEQTLDWEETHFSTPHVIKGFTVTQCNAHALQAAGAFIRVYVDGELVGSTNEEDQTLVSVAEEEGEVSPASEAAGVGITVQGADRICVAAPGGQIAISGDVMIEWWANKQRLLATCFNTAFLSRDETCMSPVTPGSVRPSPGSEKKCDFTLKFSQMDILPEERDAAQELFTEQAKLEVQIDLAPPDSPILRERSPSVGRSRTTTHGTLERDVTDQIRPGRRHEARGTPANRLRQKVSQKKLRFQDSKFDLDLTYMTDTVIAMGYPSTGVDGVFRNPQKKVQEFFEETHRGRYKVYNLCSERQYAPEVFRNRCAVYPFDDHAPPPLTMLREFCLDAEEWLGRRKNNTLAIHCKAGKGRTGVMITCLLQQTEGWDAEAALDQYGQWRTENGAGVTIPSQRRYVYYYQLMLENANSETDPRCRWNFDPPKPMFILDLINFLPDGMANFKWESDAWYQIVRPDDTIVYDSKVAGKPARPIAGQDGVCSGVMFPACEVVLAGDVFMEFYKSPDAGKATCRIGFHTFFVKQDMCAVLDEDGDGVTLEYSKIDVDLAVRDKKSEVWQADFKALLHLLPAESLHHTEARGNAMQIKQSKDRLGSMRRAPVGGGGAPAGEPADLGGAGSPATSRTAPQTMAALDEDDA